LLTMDKKMRLLGLIVLLIWANWGMAATCTSKATGGWSSSSTWDCGVVPGSADTVIIASPNTVTLTATASATNLTVNSGGTLNVGSFTLTISGNITNNSTITGTGILQSTGNSAVISGSGSFTSSVKLYTAGTAPSIAAGSTIAFTGTNSIRAGRNGSTTVTSSILTINGTLTATQTAGTNFLRLYANSTIIGSAGVITAANSTITYNASAATITNNGSVILQKITQNSSSNKWTQGTNSRLTLTLTSTVGTLYASATGNTVTYNGASSTNVSITSLSPANTYYNLAGTAVVCPTSFTILGSSPCAAGIYAVTSNPTSCNSVTGIGTVAWTSPANAYTSNSVYATAANLTHNTTTNYLRCTGYNFAVPTGATINGIIVNVQRNTSGGTFKDSAMRLVKDVSGVATIQGTDRSTLTSYTTSIVTEAHGGVADLWSGTWAVADINTANFGAAFAAYNTSTTSTTNYTVSVDSMPITVVYTPATGPDHVGVSATKTGSICNPSLVTIALRNATDNLVTGWGGTINLTTSDGTGDWAISSGAGLLNNGTANDGAATYTYSTTESSVTLSLTHTGTGAITIGVTNGASNLLANTPIAELQNSITYQSGGSFSIVSNSSGTPVPVTNLNQVAGQTSPTYYLYAVDNACTAAFTNSTKTIQMAAECGNPINCQNAPAIVTINPVGGTATALQKGVQNNTPSLTAAQYTNVSMVFNSSSRAPFTFSYADVGQITLYANYSVGGVTLFTESNPFVVKPAGFVLSGIKRSSDNLVNPAAVDATGAAFVKAGNAFSATVTALTAGGAANANAGTAINCATTPTDCTPNFGQEVTPEVVKLTPVVVPGLGLSNSGTVSGTFGRFSGGSATGTAFSWDDVGIITLTPSMADADYIGTGDIVGTTSGKIGRFYPDHFSVIPYSDFPLDNRNDLNYCAQGLLLADGVTPCVTAAQCVNSVLVSDGVTACLVAPGYTYMGETMAANFTLLAKNFQGTTTQNYSYSATAANNFAKLNPVATGSSLGFGAVDTTAPTILASRVDTSLITSSGSGSFTSGKASVIVPIAITRGTTVDGPYTALNIGIAPVDSDGVAMVYDQDMDATAGNDHTLIGSTEVRYGRVNMGNAFGSELLDLAMPLTAQYWSGTSWETNTDDNDTTGISLSASSVTGPLAALCAWDTGAPGKSGLGCSAAGTSLNQYNEPPLAGNYNLNFKAPGSGNTGAMDITATVPSYLNFNWKGTGNSNPVARASFGIYKGNSQVIYIREVY
jgi:MSHA biogenesis protein MshQ